MGRRSDARSEYTVCAEYSAFLYGPQLKSLIVVPIVIVIAVVLLFTRYPGFWASPEGRNGIRFASHALCCEVYRLYLRPTFF
jgi:hypothetical protein